MIKLKLNKLYVFGVICMAIFTVIPLFTQAQKITLMGQKMPFIKVASMIREQTGYTVFGSKEVMESIGLVTVEAKNIPLKDFLNKVLEGKEVNFVIEDNTVSITKKVEKKVANKVQSPILGFVTHKNTGDGLKGVTIGIKGQTKKFTTGERGDFNLMLGEIQLPVVLQFSYMGLKSFELMVTKSEILNITLEEESQLLNESVITGISQRKKESFTGSSATFTAKELKSVGNIGILQSLKTLDPSFKITENVNFGSDPNRMPDLEINGKSSVIGLSDEYGSNPNQPLFILDGFESTLALIKDLSMERVSSITILKDASATAIYGSSGANGVIVVETKRPEPGKMRISYTSNFMVNYADLSDYNLMNASEQFQFENLAGYYSLSNYQEYNGNLKEIVRGVDSYWLTVPIRTGIQHRQNFIAEGGDNVLRYMANLTYGNTDGVMKGSNRKTTQGSLVLNYIRGKVSLSNNLTLDFFGANREPVSFSRFASTSPYRRIYNASGGVDRNWQAFPGSYANGDFNPLYDFNNNNMFNEKHSGITNNLDFNWNLVEGLRFRTRLSLRKDMNKNEVFQSPFNSEFVSVASDKKGLFSEENREIFSYDLQANLNYNKIWKEKHVFNTYVNFTTSENSSQTSKYSATGFVDDEFANPAFASGYPEFGKPIYLESKGRRASYLLATSYSYDSRLSVDGSIRSDGSSTFGAGQQFTNIWSAGLAWNLHNEKYLPLKNLKFINEFKVRATIGNPGNLNFSDYTSTRVYSYNQTISNPFGSGVLVSTYGNPNLLWQKTLNRNLGLDFRAFNNRFNINADYYYKTTDPLLVYIGMPSSTGVTTTPRNLGAQTTKGYTISSGYNVSNSEDLYWRLSLTLAHNRSAYSKINNVLDRFNNENQSRNLVRYYDGASPTDMWAVRSLGIDPATGREIFLDKEGNQTFVHNYKDEVVVGNTEPKLEGVFGTNIIYKDFKLGLNFRYRTGGQIFLNTLYNKVENISSSTITNAQDKRALYDRWQKPGDQSKFKNIALTEITPISSRFVADNSEFIGESITLGYEVRNKKWIKDLGVSSLSIQGYLTDIFRIASVKEERGIEYPFARNVSLSLSLIF